MHEPFKVQNWVFIDNCLQILQFFRDVISPRIIDDDLHLFSDFRVRNRACDRFILQ